MATPIPRNTARFTLAEIASATAGAVVAGVAQSEVRGVAIDSRAVVQGALFVGIRGATQDGAHFVPTAVAQGASALLLHADAPTVPEVARIDVADTTRALGDLAAYHRARWGGRVVAITGSAGKTTTKELTAAALAGTGARVLKTEGNLNNQFGAPMTLLCADATHDLAVLELGTSGPGEIARLGEIARPDVAVVLLAALAHTAGLGSLAAIADEKASLFRALPEGGVAVVNADDPELMARCPKGVKTLSFGTVESADVRLLSTTLRVDGTTARVALRLPSGSEERVVQLRLLGQAAALDACAALASVIALCSPGQIEESLEAAIEGMARVPATPGRLACSATARGIIVCDDSYNANPRSMALSLETLAALARDSGGRGVAVLADMKELGIASVAEHARIGELAVKLGIDVLIGCGPEMAHATSSAARHAAGRLAQHPTRVAHVMDPLAASALAPSLVRPRDVVLVKGSRAMAMERVVAALIEKLGGAALSTTCSIRSARTLASRT